RSSSERCAPPGRHGRRAYVQSHYYQFRSQIKWRILHARSGVANLRQVTAGMVKGVRVPTSVGSFFTNKIPTKVGTLKSGLSQLPRRRWRLLLIVGTFRARF